MIKKRYIYHPLFLLSSHHTYSKFSVVSEISRQPRLPPEYKSRTSDLDDDEVWQITQDLDQGLNWEEERMIATSSSEEEERGREKVVRRSPKEKEKGKGRVK